MYLQKITPNEHIKDVFSEFFKISLKPFEADSIELIRLFRMKKLVIQKISTSQMYVLVGKTSLKISEVPKEGRRMNIDKYANEFLGMIHSIVGKLICLYIL